MLKNCNAPCRGRLIVDPPACGTERLDEWDSFPTRTVGADSIRPRHKAPLSECFVPGRHIRRPLQGVCVHPGTCENRGCGRILSAPTAAAAKPPRGRHTRRPLQSVCEPVPGQYRTGRVREPMYWYKPCALLSGGTAARADSIRPYGSSGEAGSIHPTTLLRRHTRRLQSAVRGHVSGRYHCYCLP